MYFTIYNYICMYCFVVIHLLCNDILGFSRNGISFAAMQICSGSLLLTLYNISQDDLLMHRRLLKQRKRIQSVIKKTNGL